MKKTLVLLLIVMVVFGTAITPGIAVAEEPNFDPDEVEIASLNGEDPEGVNELAIDVHENISIELAGVDEFERPLMIEIGGDVVSHLEEPEQEFRPRSDSDVTKGEQTLQIVSEERGERTIVAETQVKVTEVVLERDQDDRSGLGFDPETVEIDTIAGQDATQTNEIQIVENEEISIELDGVEDDIYAMVELDGEHIGSVTEEDNSFKPRPGRDVSEGQQTLTLVREREGERIVIAETQVDVTHVDLTQDDPTQLEFDPEAVTLDTVNGKDATEPLELSLAYDEKISFGLEGVNVREHSFLVNLDGTTIGMAGEGETAFRPRTDADVSPGEHTLEIVARSPGRRTTVAETTVVVTGVNLDRDGDRRDRPEFDSESVSIVSVNGEPADQRNELALKGGSPLTLQLDGVEFPGRGFHVEIGGEVVGILEGPDEEIRIRRDSDVNTGKQTLQVVWKSTGNRTVLAETPVEVTEVDLDRRQFDEPPEDVELEIVSVNGEPAEGVVVTEHDLRGETPIELEVEGLAETDREPNIRYKGETVPSEIEGFEIDGDELTLEHLPRVEDGDVETLELVERTGPDEVHVYDSVKIEYRHVEDQDALGEDTEEDDGGVVSNLFKLLGGGGDEAEDGETSNATEGDQEGETDEGDTSDDDGGVISTVRKLFGL